MGPPATRPDRAARRGRFCGVYEFEDGKISSFHLYFDQADLLTQLGISPAAGGLLLHSHRDFVVRDPLVPAAERRPGGILDYGLLVVVPREPANRVQVREPGNRG